MSPAKCTINCQNYVKSYLKCKQYPAHAILVRTDESLISAHYLKPRPMKLNDSIRDRQVIHRGALNSKRWCISRDVLNGCGVCGNTLRCVKVRPILQTIWGHHWSSMSVKFAFVLVVDLLSLCGSLWCPVVSWVGHWQRVHVTIHALVGDDSTNFCRQNTCISYKVSLVYYTVSSCSKGLGILENVVLLRGSIFCLNFV